MILRTNKFRGQSLRDGKWFFGNLLDRDTKGHTHITTLERGCLVINPDTVGQYIGLHDKKDREIYDGDILFVEFSDKSGGYYLVGWNEKTASWGIMDRYSYQALQEGYDFPEFKNYLLLAFLEKAIIFEVAGNSYDNPELLELRKKN